ncbi:2-nitropropane dioxygenase [Geotalea uraniireducens]|uniref:2-nitropropane dioxygenase n=1 Tax=Geotalea uraniireducens TaxID=351604 RepID=A0ABN6VS45_9BACT|nr:PfaD family polyunsaturated fatty acid/polyketide biosynthesis protein [Geotalea uraniireducens]BDV42217.1 2-nitropropane dioxygenase [Geotalea uraniireducens]
MNHSSATDRSATFGWWRPETAVAAAEGNSIAAALQLLDRPLYLVERNGTLVPETAGTAGFGAVPADSLPLHGYAPPCHPEQLGDREFCRELGLRFPYLGGSMAKGISSAAMAEALGRAGMLGFFGAAGLPFAEVEAAADRLARSLGTVPYGFNLIHSPHEPDLEDALARLYIARGIRLVEASAFLALTLPLVRYRLHGIHRAADGTIVTPNRLIAKVSREELAARFFAPPPEAFLRELVASGELSEEQAQLAAQVPMAGDVTAEADSGGHTDNRPAIALFPTILSLASRLRASHGYDRPLRVGLAGGISTPAAAAAAFAMGAAYIMTGSVNQACVESGTCNEVRAMLAETRQADVAMAPAADMFEMGVTVQVLKRGTMFPMRAAKLYEFYRTHGSYDELPAAEREKLEKTLFHAPLDEIWQQTRTYFLRRDPRQAERGDRDPKHRMALVFRWYLGQAAHWAKNGEPGRKVDYQVWCGPAMGAFNEWVAGSFLASPARREVVTVAHNILHGAAVLSRAAVLRSQGIRLPPEELRVEPFETASIKEYPR